MGNSFEDFRGDFGKLASVIEASWAEGSAPPFLYTPELLADYFAYPGADLKFAPTLYHGSELVAFVAGFPRTARLRGADLRLLVVAFLTVSVEHKSRGYGILAWSELVRRAQEAGYDGVVNYCVEGEAMNRMITGSCRRLGLPAVRAHTIGYLAKALWPSSSAPPGAAEPLPVPRFLELAEESTLGKPFARTWTAAEAAWQLGRLNAVQVHHEQASSAGHVGGYTIQVANADRTNCLIVDDVLWDGLDESDRCSLVREVEVAGRSAGARLAVVPDEGYADLQPFFVSGFRPSQRKIHAYLTVWSRPVPDEPVSSFYLDVF